MVVEGGGRAVHITETRKQRTKQEGSRDEMHPPNSAPHPTTPPLPHDLPLPTRPSLLSDHSAMTASVDKPIDKVRALLIHSPPQSPLTSTHASNT